MLSRHSQCNAGSKACKHKQQVGPSPTVPGSCVSPCSSAAQGWQYRTTGHRSVNAEPLSMLTKCQWWADLGWADFTCLTFGPGPFLPVLRDSLCLCKLHPVAQAYRAKRASAGEENPSSGYESLQCHNGCTRSSAKLLQHCTLDGELAVHSSADSRSGHSCIRTQRWLLPHQCSTCW